MRYTLIVISCTILLASYCSLSYSPEISSEPEGWRQLLGDVESLDPEEKISIYSKLGMLFWKLGKSRQSNHYFDLAIQELPNTATNKYVKSYDELLGLLIMSVGETGQIHKVQKLISLISNPYLVDSLHHSLISRAHLSKRKDDVEIYFSKISDPLLKIRILIECKDTIEIDKTQIENLADLCREHLSSDDIEEETKSAYFINITKFLLLYSEESIALNIVNLMPPACAKVRAYFCLFEYYICHNDIEKAFSFLQQMRELSDSIITSKGKFDRNESSRIYEAFADAVALLVHQNHQQMASQILKYLRSINVGKTSMNLHLCQLDFINSLLKYNLFDFALDNSDEKWRSYILAKKAIYLANSDWKSSQAAMLEAIKNNSENYKSFISRIIKDCIEKEKFKLSDFVLSQQDAYDYIDPIVISEIANYFKVNGKSKKAEELFSRALKKYNQTKMQVSIYCSIMTYIDIYYPGLQDF
jgi:tetratricopeptide (TPR) repeat protein